MDDPVPAAPTPPVPPKNIETATLKTLKNLEIPEEIFDKVLGAMTDLTAKSYVKGFGDGYAHKSPSGAGPTPPQSPKPPEKQPWLRW